MVKVIRYKDYTLKRYRRHKKCPFETYEPQKRVELKKEHTVPILFGIGNIFLNFGGIIGLGVYGFFSGLKEFLGFKKNVKNRFRRRGKVIEIKAG